MELEGVKKFLKRKNSQIFFTALVVSALVFLVAQNAQVGSWFFLIALSVLVIGVWFAAGVIVFRSLFLASAQLTFIIFLAQAYCVLPAVSRTAGDAAQSLFGFGLIYAALFFVVSLYKELSNGLAHLDKAYDGKKPWMIVILLGLFVGLFVLQVYQVVSPIVLNLCIYKF